MDYPGWIRDHKVLLVAGAIVVAGIVVYFTLLKKKTDRYLAEVLLSTSPEVLYIEGEPNKHIIRLPDGGEMIRSGDIALSEGFGVGEGTFGFGRYGSSFMA